MKNVFKIVFVWLLYISFFVTVAKIDYAQTSDDHYAQTLPDHKTVVPQGGPFTASPNNIVTFGTSPEGQPEKPSTGPVVHLSQGNGPTVSLTIEDLALVLLYTESDEHAEEIMRSLPDDVLKEVVKAMFDYDLKLQRKLFEENKPKSRI